MKVDKRRKKKAAEEADARADAVFAEEVRNMQHVGRPRAGNWSWTARMQAVVYLPVVR